METHSCLRRTPTLEKLVVGTLLLATSVLSSGCLGVLALMPEKEGRGPNPLWLLLGLGGGRRTLSSAPTVVMGASVRYPAALIETTPSTSISAPDRIEGPFDPIGLVYDIAPAYNKSAVRFGGQLVLPEGEAELRYTYDPRGLADAGLVPEFNAQYWDEFEQDWKPANRMEMNASEGRVSAYTNHLTSFVLTAVSGVRTELSPPPACIAADLPGGLGGTGAAVLTTMGDGHKFYQDRSYRIKADAVFEDLGFEGALGIATCNGGGECGTFVDHKDFEGGGYISFTAHTDLDIYLMYAAGSRADASDGSEDAPWLTASGFANTGRLIQTSSVAGRFRVYKRSVDRGTSVVLDGNQQGVKTTGIHSNYWLVLKRRGEIGASHASILCESEPNPTAGAAPGNLRGLPGETSIQLTWDVPASANYAGALVRRSTVAPPASPTAGIGVAALDSTTNRFTDTGVENNTTYFYSVFALYTGDSATPAASLRARTGTDGDKDGLSDVFERNVPLRLTLGRVPVQPRTDATLSDTDGDGISDGEELARGTDPTNPDSVPPTVTAFTRISESPTTYPVVAFTLTASDNVGASHYLLTSTAAPPLGNDARWSAYAPTFHEFGSSGSHTLYAWVRDAAGNVSALTAPIEVQIDGIKVPKFVFSGSSTGNEIASSKINPGNGALTLVQRLAMSSPSHLQTNPTKSVLHSIRAGGQVGSIGFQSGTGAIADLGSSLLPATVSLPSLSLVVAPDGDLLYANFFQTDTATWGMLTYPVNAWGSIGPPISANRGTALSPGSTTLSADKGALIATFRILPPYQPFFYTRLVRLPLPGAAFDIGTTQSFDTLPLWRGVPEVDRGLAADPLGRAIYNLCYGEGGQCLSVPAGSPLPSSLFVITVQQDDSYAHAQTIATGPSPRGLAVHPQGRFLYVANGGNGTISQYHIEANGTLTALGAFFVGGTPAAIAIDDAGRFAYVANASTGQVASYSIDNSTGLLSVAGSVAVGTNPDSIAVYSEHSANDPPIVNPGGDRWEHVGQPVTLVGARSFDPDRFVCGANTANYQYKWSVVSVPGGSGVTVGTSSIVNSNALNASFTPDVVGDYVLSLDFTDDPGSCQGAGRTSGKQLTIKAGYLHTTAPQTINLALAGNPPTPGAPPAAGAEFRITHTYDEYDGFDLSAMLVWEFDLLGFLSCKQTSDDMLSTGTDMCSAIASAATGVPSVAFGGSCGAFVSHLAGSSVSCANYYGFRLLFPYCVSKYLEQSAAVTACEQLQDANIIYKNQRWWVPQVKLIGAHHFWPVERRNMAKGHWRWWNYTP